eukprot:467644-Lingulodinium_polyedra.AAC.1
MVRRPEWRHHAIPVMLHGDAVPVVGVGKAGTKSMDNISWHPLLAQGNTLAIKLLILSIFENCKTEEAKVGMWEVIMWSFKALFRGTHPAEDWLGRPWPAGSSESHLAAQRAPLAGGFFCVLWSIKGDLDWYTKGLWLKSYNGNEP